MKKLFKTLLVTLALVSCSPKTKEYQRFDKSIEQLSVSYNVEFDSYDVFIKNENKMYRVPYKNTRIVPNNKDDITLLVYDDGTALLIFYVNSTNYFLR